MKKLVVITLLCIPYLGGKGGGLKIPKGSLRHISDPFKNIYDSSPSLVAQSLIIGPVTGLFTLKHIIGLGKEEKFKKAKQKLTDSLTTLGNYVTERGLGEGGAPAVQNFRKLQKILEAYLDLIAQLQEDFDDAYTEGALTLKIDWTLQRHRLVRKLLEEDLFTANNEVCEDVLRETLLAIEVKTPAPEVWQKNLITAPQWAKELHNAKTTKAIDPKKIDKKYEQILPTFMTKAQQNFPRFLELMELTDEQKLKAFIENLEKIIYILFVQAREQHKAGNNMESRNKKVEAEGLQNFLTKLRKKYPQFYYTAGLGEKRFESENKTLVIIAMLAEQVLNATYNLKEQINAFAAQADKARKTQGSL